MNGTPAGSMRIPESGSAAPHDVFHAVLQLQLSLFEGNFFDLFGLGKVMLGGEFVQSIFEFVVLGGEAAEFLVRSQQQFLEVL
jgi:hypothetical protein